MYEATALKYCAIDQEGLWFLRSASGEALSGPGFSWGERSWPGCRDGAWADHGSLTELRRQRVEFRAMRIAGFSRTESTGMGGKHRSLHEAPLWVVGHTVHVPSEIPWGLAKSNCCGVESWMDSRVCTSEGSWGFSLLHNRETSLGILGAYLVETLKAKPLKMPHTLEVWLTNIFYREPTSKYFRLVSYMQSWSILFALLFFSFNTSFKM